MKINTIIKNGKDFLKNPVALLIGFPITALLICFDKVVELVKQGDITTLIVFLIIYIGLCTFTYFKYSYDRLNEIVITFKKNKVMEPASRKNTMGNVEVIKKKDKMVLRGHFKFFQEDFTEEKSIK